MMIGRQLVAAHLRQHTAHPAHRESAETALESPCSSIELDETRRRSRMERRGLQKSEATAASRVDCAPVHFVLTCFARHLCNGVCLRVGSEGREWNDGGRRLTLRSAAATLNSHRCGSSRRRVPLTAAMTAPYANSIPVDEEEEEDGQTTTHSSGEHTRPIDGDRRSRSRLTPSPLMQTLMHHHRQSHPLSSTVNSPPRRSMTMMTMLERCRLPACLI